MASTADPLHLLDAALGEGRRRLRLRGALRGGAIGAWAGSAGAVIAGVIRQVGLLDDRPAALVAVGAVLLATAIGAVAGWVWRTLPDRETALLLDRALGTNEVLVTSSWLRSTPPSANRDRVLDRLAETSLPSIAKALPLRPPPHARWLPAPLVVALAALLAPAWRPALAQRAAASEDPLVQEGLKLAERLAEVPDAEGVELPEGLETEIAELARGMQGETLSPEEARQRLEELQSQLDAFEQSLAAQRDALEELESAAETLKENPATRQLGDALSDLDLGAAGDAAEQLASELGLQSPLQRQQTAEALQQAGQELAQSQDPSLQQAGRAMQQAAQEMSSAPSGQQPGGQQPGGQQPGGQQPGGQQPGGQQPGGQQPGGQQPGGQQPGGQQPGGGLSPEQARELGQALQQAREAGERLARDEAALQRSQELNGAMEGSRQRLGGEPGTEDGEGQGDRSGQGAGEAEGDGEGGTEPGEGQGAGQAANGAGSGHTWEDEGEFDERPDQGAPGARDAARDDPGRVINDFERLYRAVRDEDAEHLLTSVPGQLDASGHVDQIPIRLTGGSETSKTTAIQLPPSYREAAADAVSSEQVPPGYREAVKQYFEESE